MSFQSNVKKIAHVVSYIGSCCTWFGTVIGSFPVYKAFETSEGNGNSGLENIPENSPASLQQVDGPVSNGPSDVRDGKLHESGV